MTLSIGQKRALHVAAREAGVEDDGQRRIIQYNLGGFSSAREPTAHREGFLAVMAFYERRAGGQLGHAAPGYWQYEDAKANPLDGLRHRARTLAGRLGLDDLSLDRFVSGRRMTNGLYQDLAECPAYWLRRVIEGLKAMERRGWRARGRM